MLSKMQQGQNGQQATPFQQQDMTAAMLQQIIQMLAILVQAHYDREARYSGNRGGGSYRRYGGNGGGWNNNQHPWGGGGNGWR